MAQWHRNRAHKYARNFSYPLPERAALLEVAELAAAAPDPLPSGDDVKLARRERDDATFHRDRLREAATKPLNGSRRSRRSKQIAAVGRT
jgi:hypothetical protein